MLLTKTVYLVMYKIQGSKNDVINGERVVFGSTEKWLTDRIFDDERVKLGTDAAMYEWNMLTGLTLIRPIILHDKSWDDWIRGPIGGNHVASEINKVFCEHLYWLVSPIEITNPVSTKE